MKTSLPSLNKAFAVSGLLAALLVASMPARADEMADVSKAIRAGQYADAMSKADAYLSKRPKDPNMRFLKGLILTDQNKSAEAIAVFTKLTEDYPELPEPYNNLAVLFAANGQYDKARLALDNAIRTNPAYATAYANLGDVHAKLASQAYDKALQLDSGNTAVKTKLTLLRSLPFNSGVKAPEASAPIVAAAPTPTPVVAAANTPKPVPALAAATPAPAPAPAAASVAKPVVAAKPEVKSEVKPEPKPEPKPAAKPAQDSETEDILTAVHGWAKAWSDQDVKTYLNYYGGEFETPKGESRKDWADERRQRIEGKNRIEVKVESPQVTINGNTATVKFRQIYSSDRLKADSRKTLVLTRQNGKWQIKQERAGS
ncbi:MAG TPA: tetratricopeptide repeat protein [Burkholderiaceae bacterium]